MNNKFVQIGLTTIEGVTFTGYVTIAFAGKHSDMIEISYNGEYKGGHFIVDMAHHANSKSNHFEYSNATVSDLDVEDHNHVDKVVFGAISELYDLYVSKLEKPKNAPVKPHEQSNDDLNPFG